MSLPQVQLYCANCLDKLPEIPSKSVDAVITDPPYPCIKRDYGYWTVKEWWAMMRPVVAETRRILKPTGSAVFILQPNSEHVGQMRGWLWEFMAWVCRDWNMVQDVWWWNSSAPPVTHCNRHNQLMRPSVKACVWAGGSECYRNQQEILWIESARNAHWRAFGKNLTMPSGHSMKQVRCANAAQERGGVTPFNLIPWPNSGNNSHGAGTPLKLADWWTRYICPPGGTVLDMFMGSGTMGVAAVNNGCNFVGIEKLDEPGYFPTAQERIGEALEKAKEPKQMEMEV